MVNHKDVRLDFKDIQISGTHTSDEEKAK